MAWDIENKAKAIYNRIQEDLSGPVPEPSKELKDVLFIKKRLNKLQAQRNDIEEERRIIEACGGYAVSNIYGYRINSLGYRIGNLEKCLKHLSKLCSTCKGKQAVGGSTERLQPANKCPACKGTGLENK